MDKETVYKFPGSGTGTGHVKKKKLSIRIISDCQQLMMAVKQWLQNSWKNFTSSQTTDMILFSLQGLKNF